MQIKIKSVNISIEKGTIKQPVDSIELTSNGIRTDAHSGKWHRQVSLLAWESMEKFGKLHNQEFKYGEFAENITTEGMELFHMRPLDRLYNDNVDLQVTQIGKKCHGDGCAIYRETGTCVMPKEGIFARVIKPGIIKAGDKLTYQPKIFQIHIITLSDRASQGEYEDLSGPAIKESVEVLFSVKGYKFEVHNHIIPDNRRKLKYLLEKLFNTADLIITTGGTGIGPRDITVDTVQPFLHKEIPGIMDLVRMKYGLEKPNAVISRSIAGVRKKTLVFCLPGSPKACKEYMTEINQVLFHLYMMLYGIDSH
jgi:molybdopterin adenylyltransferase